MSDDMSELVNRLSAALGRQRPVVDADSDDDGRGPPRSVPYHRFRTELEARKSLAAELESIKGMVEELKSGHAAALESVRTSAAESVTALQAQHAEDLGLMEAGFKSSTDRKTLRMVWEDLPKTERGKTPGDWWRSVIEAHAAHIADPEAAPVPKVATPLTPYLPKSEAPKPAQRATQPAAQNWMGPPAGPSQRTVSDPIGSAPVDQGLDAFLAALPTS